MNTITKSNIFGKTYIYKRTSISQYLLLYLLIIKLTKLPFEWYHECEKMSQLFQSFFFSNSKCSTRDRQTDKGPSKI